MNAHQCDRVCGPAAGSATATEFLTIGCRRATTGPAAYLPEEGPFVSQVTAAQGS